MMDEIVDYNNRSRFFASQLIPGSVKQRAGIYFCCMIRRLGIALAVPFILICGYVVLFTALPIWLLTGKSFYNEFVDMVFDKFEKK